MLLIGGPGTAKTSTVLQVLTMQSLASHTRARAPSCTRVCLQVLAKQSPASVATKSISFSSATTPLIFQNNVEGCAKRQDP